MRGVCLISKTIKASNYPLRDKNQPLVHTQAHCALEEDPNPRIKHHYVLLVPVFQTRTVPFLALKKKNWPGTEEPVNLEQGVFHCSWCLYCKNSIETNALVATITDTRASVSDIRVLFLTTIISCLFIQDLNLLKSIKLDRFETSAPTRSFIHSSTSDQIGSNRTSLEHHLKRCSLVSSAPSISSLEVPDPRRSFCSDLRMLPLPHVISKSHLLIPASWSSQQVACIRRINTTSGGYHTLRWFVPCRSFRIIWFRRRCFLITHTHQCNSKLTEFHRILIKRI